MKIKKLTKILYISSNNIDNGKTLLLCFLMIFSVLLLASLLSIISFVEK